MTARKIAVAILLCGLAVYFVVNWGIERYRARGEAPPPEPEPEPDRIEDATFRTTSERIEGVDAEPWRSAYASADIPLGAVVSVGEFGEDAGVLTVRQRGDVVASELVVVAHRDDVPPRSILAFVGDLGDDFVLEHVTLLVRAPKED
jgi:hypothetical protein